MRLYRFATPAPTPWVFIKSLVAASVIWAVAAWAIPLGLVRWQQTAGLHHLFIGSSRALGVLIGAIGALIGLWCAVVLALAGRGTVLPFDAPRRLVTAGPYAWLRNPMISALVLTVFGAGVGSGSLLVFVYALALALGWQLFLASAGERDLERVFGREYEAWRRAVRLWVPSRRRFAGAESMPPVWFSHRRRGERAWE